MSPSSYFRLLRWLGPWADPEVSPAAVLRREHVLEADELGTRPLRIWLYSPEPKRSIGSYLVAHGLTLGGPADPRLDRFLRILAAAGFLVCAPFLPDHNRLLVRASAAADLERALRFLLSLEERPAGTRPGLFSVSFGCLPALRLAASARTAELIGALVVFGGCVDPRATIRFTLGVREPGAPGVDPLSVPAVAINLLGVSDLESADLEPVLQGWYEFVEHTWGKAEMRETTRHRALAESIAARMAPDHAALFRVGCGLTHEARLHWLTALEDWKGAAEVDPRPQLAGLRCPVYVFHSVQDDVIPYSQSYELAASMPPHVRTRHYLTGLLHHTGSRPLRELLREMRGLTADSLTTLRMLAAMVRAGKTP